MTIVGDLFFCRLQLLTDHVFPLVLTASSFVRQPTVTSSGVARVVGICRASLVALSTCSVQSIPSGTTYARRVRPQVEPA